MEAIKFHNYTDEDFTWKYDGIAYTFKAGQEMYLEDFKAHFFAKHLADLACNRAGIPTNDPRHAEFEAKALPSEESIPAEVAVDLEAKKARKTKKKVEEEEEFADLKD